MTAGRFRVEFARSAEDDLLDILAWHASQNVPEVGSRLVASLLERSRWHEYWDIGRSTDLDDLLHEVDADPTGIFWG